MLDECDLTYEEIVLGEAVTTRALHAIADLVHTRFSWMAQIEADELASWLQLRQSGSLMLWL